MKRSLSMLFLLLGPACVHSYKDLPRQSFAEIPYESLKGEAWPVNELALPGIRAQYELPEDPKVAYVELNPEGKKTLIFIHGLGSYLKFWRYQLDSFAARGYHVIAIDMIGFGKSSKPASFPYTMEAMADVVREVKNALGADRPVLVGHSMGGQTALSYAIRYPEELSQLVLTAPAGFEEFSKREKEWFRSVITTSAIKNTPEENIWGSIRKNNFFRWQDEMSWLVEERVRLVGTPDFDPYAYANVKAIHGLTETDFVRANLQKIKVPTLIVYGDKDRLIPNPFMHGGDTREVMEFGSKNIAGAKLVGLTDCGHMLQMDCADAYNREVAEFLGQLPAAEVATRRNTED